MKILFFNKKFGLNYSAVETYESGMVLKGTEVKSIIKANANIDEAFCLIQKDEMYLLNMYVAPFEHGNINNVEATRKRKLLLHKNEISKIEYKIKKANFNLVPTKVYLSKGNIKIEIALATHKNSKDKRQDLKKRDDSRLIREKY
jgi:SsrA-binding protein